MQLVDCKRKKGRRPLILHESLCLELFPSVSFLTLPPSYPFPLHPRLAFPFSSHCPQPSSLFSISVKLLSFSWNSLLYLYRYFLCFFHLSDTHRGISRYHFYFESPTCHVVKEGLFSHLYLVAWTKVFLLPPLLLI